MRVWVRWLQEELSLGSYSFMTDVRKNNCVPQLKSLGEGYKGSMADWVHDNNSSVGSLDFVTQDMRDLDEAVNAANREQEAMHDANHEQEGSSFLRHALREHNSSSRDSHHLPAHWAEALPQLDAFKDELRFVESILMH